MAAASGRGASPIVLVGLDGEPPETKHFQAMSEHSVATATIRGVSRLTTGSWGDDSALALTFELSDGRTTQPTYIPGQWQIADLLEMLDVASIEELVGSTLRVVLLDPDSPSPMVTELLSSAVPESFRRAFDEEA
jgi:hypothetical protein